MSGCCSGTLGVRCCTSVVSRVTICPCCSISSDTEKEKESQLLVHVYNRPLAHVNLVFPKDIIPASKALVSTTLWDWAQLYSSLH